MAELTIVEAVNQALALEMARDDRVLVFGEDVGRTGGVFRATDGLYERFGANRLSGSYAGVARALGAHAERVEQPDEVVAAIERGIAATREGRPAVLEMITKEDPVYPAAAELIPEVAAGLLTAV